MTARSTEKFSNGTSGENYSGINSKRAFSMLSALAQIASSAAEPENEPSATTRPSLKYRLGNEAAWWKEAATRRTFVTRPTTLPALRPQTLRPGIDKSMLALPGVRGNESECIYISGYKPAG
jgi:hypothetical protein